MNIILHPYSINPVKLVEESVGQRISVLLRICKAIQIQALVN
jgi:hypothetical protein